MSQDLLFLARTSEDVILLSDKETEAVGAAESTLAEPLQLVNPGSSNNSCAALAFSFLLTGSVHYATALRRIAAVSLIVNAYRYAVFQHDASTSAFGASVLISNPLSLPNSTAAAWMRSHLKR